MAPPAPPTHAPLALERGGQGWGWWIVSWDFFHTFPFRARGKGMQQPAQTGAAFQTQHLALGSFTHRQLSISTD